MGGREGDAWAGCAQKRDGGEVESGEYTAFVTFIAFYGLAAPRR